MKFLLASLLSSFLVIISTALNNFIIVTVASNLKVDPKPAQIVLVAFSFIALFTSNIYLRKKMLYQAEAQTLKILKSFYLQAPSLLHLSQLQ